MRIPQNWSFVVLSNPGIEFGGPILLTSFNRFWVAHSASLIWAHLWGWCPRSPPAPFVYLPLACGFKPHFSSELLADFGLWSQQNCSSPAKKNKTIQCPYLPTYIPYISRPIQHLKAQFQWTKCVDFILVVLMCMVISTNNNYQRPSFYPLQVDISP